MTGPPRDRRRFDAGQRNREAIRQIMLKHARQFPLAKPLTGAQIRLRLHEVRVYLAESTVLWHVAQIRLAADLAALAADEAERCNRSNSSPPDAAA